MIKKASENSKSVAKKIKLTKTTNKVDNCLQYDGQVKQVFGIWFINVLLNIVTIGVYSFWGKTRIRRYIVGSFSLLNKRFEYTGRGIELFLGFLKVLPILIIVYLPLLLPVEIFLNFMSPPIYIIMIYSIYLIIFYLIIVGIYFSLRYKFSRTTWSGIRFRLVGSGFKYAIIYVVLGILNIITLGIFIPYSDIKLYKYITENSSLGIMPVVFDNSQKSVSSELLKINILTLLLAIPTFTLSRVWYRAALLRYQYEFTSIDNLKLESTYTGWSLLKLFLVNSLIIILSVGLGKPIVIQRNLRYFANNTLIIGDLDAKKIKQSKEKLKSSGEGLASGFEADTGFI